jgi:hypothetical protein
MIRTKSQAVFLLSMLAVVSCKKVEQLPPVPRIEFTSISIYDTVDILGNHAKAGQLKFYFEDGDGDVGLNPPAEGQPEPTDMFFTLYKKKNGILLPDDTLSYRIPYMERLGQNKILKGTISVNFSYLFFNLSDTIKYEFYIEDRAKHESNKASTVEIPLSVNNVYKN